MGCHWIRVPFRVAVQGLRENVSSKNDGTVRAGVLIDREAWLQWIFITISGNARKELNDLLKRKWFGNQQKPCRMKRDICNIMKQKSIRVIFLKTSEVQADLPVPIPRQFSC